MPATAINSPVADGSIVRWDHETGTRTPFAPDLAVFGQRRLADPEWR
jgi:hypothetical protein